MISKGFLFLFIFTFCIQRSFETCGVCPSPPPNCQHGSFKDSCGCDECYKGIDESCNPDICSGSLLCCEDSSDSRCRDSYRCGCVKTCESATASVPIPNEQTCFCRYGYDTTSCLCYPVCLNGEGELCGDKNSVEGGCYHQFKCVDAQNAAPVPGVPPVKICVRDPPRSSTCSGICVPSNCDQLLTCNRGKYYENSCSCCQTCFSGPDGDCTGDKLCGFGLYCYNGKCKGR